MPASSIWQIKKIFIKTSWLYGAPTVRAHTHTHRHTETPGDWWGTRGWWTDRSDTHPAWVIISWSGGCSQWALLRRGQGSHSPGACLQVVFTRPSRLPYNDWTSSTAKPQGCFSPLQPFNPVPEDQHRVSGDWPVKLTRLSGRAVHSFLFSCPVLFLKSASATDGRGQKKRKINPSPALWGYVAIK